MLGKHSKRLGLSKIDEYRYCLDLECQEDIVHKLCECESLQRTGDLQISRSEGWNITDLSRKPSNEWTSYR